MAKQLEARERQTARTSTPDVTTAVVGAVADAKAVDPLDLPPLYEAVDPDALGDLVGGAAGGARIEFAYAGCRVVVRGDGTVAVDAGE